MNGGLVQWVYSIQYILFISLCVTEQTNTNDVQKEIEFPNWYLKDHYSFTYIPDNFYLEWMEYDNE